MATIFGAINAKVPCGSKILSKLLYLAQFSKYQHFCVLQILRKIRKGCHFWRDKISLKNVLVNLQSNPVDQKFGQNHSIVHGFRDTGIFVFSLFGKFIIINYSAIS